MPLSFNWLKKYISKGIVSHFPSKSGQVRYVGNAHMFIDDLGKGLLPLRGRTEKYPDFAITLRGNDIESGREVLKGLVRTQRFYNDNELLCDLVNDLAKNIFYFTGVKYTREDPRLVGLKFFTGDNCFRLPFITIQYVPKLDRDKFRSILKYEFNKNIFQISVFVSFSERLRYRIVLWLLGIADNVSPDFFQRERFQNRVGLSIEEFNKLRSSFIASITKAYGWKQRSLSNRYINEYYLVYSTLRSSLKKIEYRDKIISQLNTLLAKLGIDAVIEVQGLPDKNRIEAAIESLKKGELDFRDSINLAYF